MFFYCTLECLAVNTMQYMTYNIKAFFFIKMLVQYYSFEAQTIKGQSNEKECCEGSLNSNYAVLLVFVLRVFKFLLHCQKPKQKVLVCISKLLTILGILSVANSTVVLEQLHLTLKTYTYIKSAKTLKSSLENRQSFWQCCRCLSLIPDPDFYPFPNPDPRSQIPDP